MLPFCALLCSILLGTVHGADIGILIALISVPLAYLTDSLFNL